MTGQPPSYDGTAEVSQPVEVTPELEGRSFDVRGLLVDAAVVGLGMVVIAAVAGVVWSWVVEPSQYVRFEDRPGQDELALSQVFGVTAWYVVVAGVAGLLAGVLAGFLRVRNLVATLLLLVSMSLVAAVLMHLVGFELGPEDPQAMLQNAAPGTRADAPLLLDLAELFRIQLWGLSLELRLAVAYLAWPIGCLAGMLIPLLGRSD